MPSQVGAGSTCSCAKLQTAALVGHPEIPESLINNIHYEDYSFFWTAFDALKGACNAPLRPEKIWRMKLVIHPPDL